MTTKPRVSVIIRTYKRAAYLREAIESVFAQTIRDYELIVVDDGSSDDTRELLLHYGGRLTPMHLAHCGNPALTFNAGVRAARGDYIAFLDDDDLWLPTKLEQQLRALDAQHRFGYGNVRILYAEGRTSPPALTAAQLTTGFALRALVRDMCVHPSTLVFHRDCLAQVELPDERQPVAETFYFSLRLARVANASCVREPIALIRHHATRLSIERGLSNYQAAVSALERLLSDRTLPLAVRMEAHRSLARYQAHLAKTLFTLGRTDAARAHALQALRHYPLHRPAWRWMLRSLLSARG
ncbi:MAG: glycosyltransferase [Chloroflexi bacterium]|nr:glycosyltransferase [Chloroflexota bacterium]